MQAAEPLAPYVPDERQPWNLARVHHLHWRASFGATWDELRSGVERGPDAVLTTLLAGTRELGVPQRASDLLLTLQRSAFTSASIRRHEAVWFWRMLLSADPLGERLTLMWHDHFATSYEKVANPTFMANQNAALREHARGSFRDLLPAIVKQPALLLWLDAPSNYREHPNENLARELLELFTLGEGNYGEHDVREVARALTGWRIDHEQRFWFYPEHHDTGEKAILGQRAAFDGDRVLTMLLEHPATARRVAWRLASTLLAAPLVTDAVLDAIAKDLAATQLAIGPAVERILRSNVFFSDSNLRALPTPPAVHVTALARALECFDPPCRTSELAAFSAAAGQQPYHPPSVFGWPRGKDWITTGALVARAKFARALVSGALTPDAAERPIARLLRTHRVGADAAERVSFFCRLLLGGEPDDALRAGLVAVAASQGTDACEEMVIQLCSSPHCQLG
ncbi:MAG TPA: DUF1800 domain-containing protein [Planctomycetota bacterium]